MTDKKISQLNSATTPLAGTEVLPIVQSGSTVKVSVDNLTAGKTVTATKLIPTGNVTAGNGMYLPAANTLALSTDGGERLRISSTGDMGVNTTSPAPTGGGANSSLSCGDLAVFQAANNVSTVASNAYFDGSWKYRTTAAASSILSSQSAGYPFLVRYAASGTAGTGITWSEALRVDTSGNVGIGTASPSTLLHVSGSSDVAKLTTSSGGGLVLNRDTAVGDNSVHFKVTFTNSDSDIATIQTINRTGGTTSTGTGYELRTTTAGTGYLSYYTNGSERLRIDASGNMGLGVTPSAWGTSVRRAIQVNSGSIDSGSATGSNVAIRTNEYFNGTNSVYINTQAAAAYVQNNGQHTFYTAPSGTAGTNVSYTQAATLEADGDFLVGTTSDTGAVANTASVVGGYFRTQSGANASVANDTFVTLVDLNDNGGLYIFQLWLGGNATTGSAWAVIAEGGAAGTTPIILTQNDAGGGSVFQISGSNVQAKQLTGGAATINWSYLRLF